MQDSHISECFLTLIGFFETPSTFQRNFTVCCMQDVFVFQQQQLVAIDNSHMLISSLLRRMASLSSFASSAAVDVQTSDGQMTWCHNDAAVSSQSSCSRASSSSSSSSERHTTSSADSGLALHCSSLSVINDVMNVTSDDNHSAFVGALVAFVKV